MTDSEKIKKIEEILEQWRTDTETFSDAYMNEIDDIVNDGK